MLNASVCSSGMSSVSRGSSACRSCLLNTEFGIFDCVAFSLVKLVGECPGIVSASSMFNVSFQSEVHVDVTFSPEFCKRKMMKALY
jgi:hypothetical protein